ncbi:MAG: ubiquinol-cytochrome C chaperone family protein [Alphaproteobacteria bacterium]
MALTLPFRRNTFLKGTAPLYVALVDEARDPRFYTEMGVEDTIDGRFDLVALYVLFMIRRLRLGEAQGFKDKHREAAAQALFDYMLADFDRNLREMGIGDLSIGKRMKKIGAALYGRAQAYDQAMASGDKAILVECLRRNLYREADVAEAILTEMADHVVALSARFADQPYSDLVAGKLIK